MTVTAPGMSNVLRAVLGAALGQHARRQRAAASPIGTLTNSTQRQLRPLVRIPPSSTPGGAAGAGDRAPDAERAVALGALGEGGGDDRQRGRGDDRGAEALHRARGDQPRLGLREAAGKRGEREQHQADHEHPPAPQQVGEAAAQQQEAAERERVGVDDPREVVAGEVQRGRRSTAARR